MGLATRSALGPAEVLQHIEMNLAQEISDSVADNGGFHAKQRIGVIFKDYVA